MDIDNIRSEIDNIDHELVHLFQMRMSLVSEVAHYKAANNLPIFNAERENEILKNLIPEGELGPYTNDFLKSIFDISKKYQSILIMQEG
jgi:chorismate mutase / prephenate dehydratase